MDKKDFQKTIALIRTELKDSYPKAMLTSQQKAKNTATVNCACRNADIANYVIASPVFKEFLKRYNATAKIETVSCGAYWTQWQVRINY